MVWTPLPCAPQHACWYSSWNRLLPTPGKYVRHFPIIWGQSHTSTPIHPALSYVTPGACGIACGTSKSSCHLLRQALCVSPLNKIDIMRELSASSYGLSVLGSFT